MELLGQLIFLQDLIVIQVKPTMVLLKADFTVTLTALKQGFLDPRSLEYTGKVILETLAVKDCFKEAGLFEYVGRGLRKGTFKKTSL